MSDLKVVLLKILYGKDDNLCSLCCKMYPENKLNSLADDIVFSSGNNLNILNVIACVLGEQFKNNLETLHWICSTCTEALVSSYNFVHICHETSKKIHNILDNYNKFIDEYLKFNKYGPVYINIDINGDLFSSMGNTNENFSDFEGLISNEEKYTVKESEDFINFAETDIFEQQKDKSIKSTDLRCKDDQSAYKCKLCLQAYSSGQNLMKHYYGVHAPKKYSCNICAKRYATIQLLKDHMNSSHTKAVCSQCGKVLTSKLSLKNHERSHVTRHICPHCGKFYRTNTSFKKHTQSCGTIDNTNKKEKYICDHCGKKYSQKSNLRVHVQMEHGNWKCHTCDWCNKRCSSISKLMEHIVTHTKDKKFSCEICGGSFVSKKSLLYHTRLHTGEKPYSCSYCDQTFLSASRRSAHVNYQHLSALEECDICNKKFRGKVYLSKHRKRHFDPNSRLHSNVE